ncbi:hypothetical protein BZG02_13350 [Labilibaculum filiforme]|uniref:Uncharacterized protein n=1 Tax=Labilibaculum filiforme TaxID=1940526 RepID=A0A2N3HW57_9BACT|nr:outer membrane beta-barrel protein [Labilibaculum filiforme]PKQ62294.1 hypothetical protein BZG02_13350 [Labilibaculum filiforme]
MLKDNKHMDSLFADGLKNLSATPSPKVWEGINGQLMGAKKKRRLVIYLWTGIAASILLLLAVGNHYFMGQGNYNMQLETLSETRLPIENELEVATPLPLNKEKQIAVERKLNKGNVSSQLPNRKMATALPIQEEGSTSESIKSELGGLVNTNTLEEDKPSLGKEFLSKDNHLAFLDQDFMSVESKSIAVEKLFNLNDKLPTQLIPNTSLLSKETDYALLADEIQIQKNIAAMELLGQEKNKDNKWSLIGQVSSSYSSYSGTSKSGNSGTGIWSVGGGAKVNYAMNDKLALQTGIVYNRFGQDMSTHSRNDRVLMQTDANIVPEEAFATQGRNYPSQTAAGPIKLSGRSGAFMASPSDTEVRSSYSSANDLIQNFKSIEIPLLMRYNLIQKRVGMFVSGGLSANMIVGNGVYDQLQGNKKIGEIDGIRTTNFSSQFSFGLEYRLSPKLQIGLEPSVKYYLNSINTSSQYDYKPYSIGVFTGIRYDF